MNPRDMMHEQYGLFFDVRRSIRYHDRRRAFFERMHQLTGSLTVLLAGSVLFDIARPGESPWWLLFIAAVAAILSAWDMVVGYASKAELHRSLKIRFGDLEIAILEGDDTDATWKAHRLQRLRIEQDEPPIYRALDMLCHNELLQADGFSHDGDDACHYAKLDSLQKATRHILHWANISPS